MFKPGDRIKRIGPNWMNGMIKGHIYTFQSYVNDTHYSIIIEGLDDVWAAHKFELVGPKDDNDLSEFGDLFNDGKFIT